MSEGDGGGPDPGAAASRLGEIAERLGASELPDEEASELAREAAELVQGALAEIDRRLAEAEGDPGG